MEYSTIIIITFSSIIFQVICGLLCENILRSKGYGKDNKNPCNGFAWGLFLGVIGLVVCATMTPVNTECKKSNNSPNKNVSDKETIRINQIKKYKDLLDSGAITEEEFIQAKNRILNKTSK